MPMARSIARRHWRPGLDLDELTGESYRGLIDAALTYDFPAHLTAFASYARPKCHARCADAVAVAPLVHGSERYQRRPSNPQFRPAPGSIDDCGMLDPDPDDERCDHLELALSECSTVERRALSLVSGIAGPELSIGQIARRLGITKLEVAAAIASAMAKVSEVFDREDWPTQRDV
jgi:DNA-directed RNA polymerase specialized sigma24 family protein